MGFELHECQDGPKQPREASTRVAAGLRITNQGRPALYSGRTERCRRAGPPAAPRASGGQKPITRARPRLRPAREDQSPGRIEAASTSSARRQPPAAVSITLRSPNSLRSVWRSRFTATYTVLRWRSG